MTNPYEGTVASFGGDVSTRAGDAPFRGGPRDPRGGAQPARTARADRGDHAPHRVRGHQVRLLPAGLDHRPRDGQGRGRRLLPAGRREGLPARLRRDRQPVHRPRRQLHRLRPRGVRAGGDRGPRARSPPLPWDPRVARVFCDCYDTETGELLDADPRQNLKRVVAAVRGGARLQLPDRHRARDDVAQAGRGRRRARGRHQALLLPHPPVRGTASGAARRGRVRAGARARHELRRPRGRARASSS